MRAQVTNMYAPGQDIAMQSCRRIRQNVRKARHAHAQNNEWTWKTRSCERLARVRFHGKVTSHTCRIVLLELHCPYLKKSACASRRTRTSLYICAEKEWSSRSEHGIPAGCLVAFTVFFSTNLPSFFCPLVFNCSTKQT